MAASFVEKPGASPPSLELVELELALRHQDFIETGFEGAVRQALARIGGSLLFKMRMDGVEGCDWVAAVSLGADDERTLAIVAQPTNGGPLLVEEAGSSELPVARLAKAYVDLMKRLATDPGG